MQLRVHPVITCVLELFRCMCSPKKTDKPEKILAKSCTVKGAELFEMLIYLPCLGATEGEELHAGLTLSYGKEKTKHQT